LKDQFEVLVGSTTRPPTLESHRHFTVVVHHIAEADGTGIYRSEAIEWIASLCITADTSLTGSIEGISTPVTVQSMKYFGIAVHRHTEFDVAAILWKEVIAVEFRFT
jgi:hypothetical protein